MNVNRCWSIVLRLLCLACAHVGMAQAAGEHARLLSDYTHRAWTAGDGAPAQIHAIRQAADGSLWLSASTGLYRFDGVNFERRTDVDGQPLLSNVILALETTPDGSTWIGYRFGGISRYKDGKAWHYGAEQGFPSGLPLTFASAPDGTVWATTSAGLAWLQDGRWRQVGPDSGFRPGSDVWQVAFDHSGTQWVVTANGAYFRPRGEQRYRHASPASARPKSVVVAPDGSVWGSDGIDASYRLTAGAAPPRRAGAAPDLPGSGIAFDRQGTLWLSRHGSVERVFYGVAADPRQKIGLEQGLSGLSPQTFFEDRDGNVWIGTAAGLDQFRPNRVRPLPTALDISASSLAADSHGDVWVSDLDHEQRAYRMDAAGRRRETLPRSFFFAITGRDGHALLAMDDGIWRAGERGGKLLAYPASLAQTKPALRALAEQRGGAVWAGFLDAGVYRYRDGAWQAMRAFYPALPRTRVMAMLGDQEGRVWIGYVNNRIAVIDGAGLTLLGVEQGLDVGNVQCIYQRNGHLWVAGDAGVAWYDGARFIALRPADGRDLHGISGVVETAEGALWLHGHDGAFHFEAAQVAAFLRHGSAPSYDLLGADDGLAGAQSPVGPFPSMVEAGDKRLWLASNNGPVLITPGQIRRDSRAPLVQIGLVESHGQRYSATGLLRLPTGASNLHIGFSAVNVSVPGSTVFRYKLDGVDREWQAAGARREALYTNLGPGNYRFQVTAANRDGVWSAAGASLAVTIPPTFWQSAVFKVLCVLAAAALVALAYRWRIAQLARMIEARQAERLSERERIARALHDTLLQEVQGAMLMMHAAAAQLPAALPQRAMLERGMGYIEQALIEGRNEVRGLRDAELLDEALPVALQRIGERMASGLAARFRFEQRDALASVPQAWRAEVFAIGREAIGNALRHASASEVVLELGDAAGRFTLTVRDDGVGFLPQVLDAGGRSGHWGLAGMRERAAAMGATLDIGNRREGGAFVRLVLPAAPGRRGGKRGFPRRRAA